MAGVSSYKAKEIRFVLKSIVRKTKQALIIDEFRSRFEKTLNANQIRYIKNKYGKDPKYGSPLVNFKGNHAGDMKYFRPSKRTEELDEDEEGSDSGNEKAAMPAAIPERPFTYAVPPSRHLPSDAQQLVVTGTGEAHHGYQQPHPDWREGGNGRVDHTHGNIQGPYPPVEGNHESIQSNAFESTTNNGCVSRHTSLSTPHIDNNLSQSGFDAQSAFGSNYQSYPNPISTPGFGQLSSRDNLYNVPDTKPPAGNLPNVHSMQAPRQQFLSGNGNTTHSGRNGFNSAGLPMYVPPHGQTRATATTSQQSTPNPRQFSRYAPYPSPAQNSRDSTGPGWSPSSQFQGAATRFNRRSSTVKMGLPMSEVTGQIDGQTSTGAPGQIYQVPSHDFVPGSSQRLPQGFPNGSYQGQTRAAPQPAIQTQVRGPIQLPALESLQRPHPGIPGSYEQGMSHNDLGAPGAVSMGDFLTPSPQTDLSAFVLFTDAQQAISSTTPKQEVSHSPQDAKPQHASGSDDLTQSSGAESFNFQFENAADDKAHEKSTSNRQASPLAVDPSLQIGCEDQQPPNNSPTPNTTSNGPDLTENTANQSQEREAPIGDSCLTNRLSQPMPSNFTESEEFLSVNDNMGEFEKQFSLLASDPNLYSYDTSGLNEGSLMYPYFNLFGDQTINPEQLSRF